MSDSSALIQPGSMLLSDRNCKVALLRSPVSKNMGYSMDVAINQEYTAEMVKTTSNLGYSIIRLSRDCGVQGTTSLQHAAVMDVGALWPRLSSVQ
jgi:hypothetical protein